jgi:hypothetical protein
VAFLLMPGSSLLLKGSLCSKLEASPQTLAKVDMRRFVVSAWCIHPDLIPCEKIIFIPEPELMHVYGPPELMQVFASAS